MSLRRGFTLIELLVVIAIVAVVAVAVILTLNPAELLKQSRDSGRLADLATMNKAMAAFQADGRALSMGTSGIMYVSLPSASSTCGTYALPYLGSGYAYRCVATSTFRATDGTGWLPVNLGQLSSGSPLSALPADPVNSASRYYAYVTASSTWAFSASLESAKYLAQSAQRDGGSDAGRYEVGSNLALGAAASGLIGYWTLDDNAGAVAADISGKGANGTVVGSPTWLSGASCKRGSCLQFSAGKYVDLTGLQTVSPETTVSFWMRWNGTEDMMAFGFGGYDLFFWNGVFGFNTACSGVRGASHTGLANTWTYVTAVFSENMANTRLYFNGVAQTLGSGGGIDACLYAPQGTAARISGWPYGGYEFGGILDDVRMYNRSLSASEVADLYLASQ